MRAELRHRAKFRQNRSSRGQDKNKNRVAQKKRSGQYAVFSEGGLQGRSETTGVGLVKQVGFKLK